MSFFKINNSVIIYSLVFLIIIPIFGFNLLLNVLGNILMLLLLIPLLIFLIAFISFNSLKSKFNVCQECGSISLGINNSCMNCGANIGNLNLTKPGETTIEVKAEKIN